MIEIYTQNQCPPCAYVKQYFNDKNIPFVEKNIQQNHQFKIEMIDYNAMSTPLIKINDELIYQVDINEIERVLKREHYV